MRKISLHIISLLVLLVPLAGKANTPNIIIILADDLGAGDLSMNGSVINTPNIDQLAAEGVTLTDFYTSANICTPSRAGLLTGRYPIRTGLAEGVIETDSTHGLSQAETTIAEFLLKHNYETALIGKWHLGHQPEFWPTEHGFNYYFGVPYSNDMQPFSLYRNTKLEQEQIDQTQLTKQYTAETITYIQEYKDKPFFIYLAHNFPHIPLYASENFRGKSKAGIYGDSVEELDWSVGEIIKTLKQTGLDKQTLVFFTSDNGAWFEGSNHTSRGMKGLSWDGGYRVPLIVWWPGMIKPATVSKGISMNIDLFPTIANLVAKDKAALATLDGKDIWSLLQGKQQSPHQVLYLFNNEDIASIRTQNWKYITHAYYRTNYIGFEGVKQSMGFDYQLLFNMNNKETERYSMAENEPAVLKQMQTYMLQARQKFDPLRTKPAAKTIP